MLIDPARQEQLLEAAKKEKEQQLGLVQMVVAPLVHAQMPEAPKWDRCAEHPEFAGETARKKCPSCAAIRAVVSEWRGSRAYKKAMKLAAFNVESNDHLGWLLFEQMALPVLERTDTGKARVTIKVLEALIEKRGVEDEAREVLRALVRLAHIDHRIGVDLCPPVGGDGRVHPHYTLEGTAIGRLRSGLETFDADKWAGDSYNAQNVPKEVRGIYWAPEGKVLVELDASQIEWVLMMLLARCDRAVKAYDVGYDVHSTNARDVLASVKGWLWNVEAWDGAAKEQRRVWRAIAKSFTHAADYDEWYVNLAHRLRLEPKIASAGQKAYFAAWPEIVEWKKEVHDAALANKCLRNPFGRVRRFLDVTVQMRGGVKRLALNRDAYKEALAFGPASTNADLWKVVLADLHEAGFEIVTGTHDSFLLEVEGDSWEQETLRAMEVCTRLVPELAALAGRPWRPRFEAKVGRRWEEEAEDWIPSGVSSAGKESSLASR